MVPRQRDQKNNDLPKNLYRNHGIFMYRKPSGKRHSLGGCLERAIAVAKQLNEHYAKADPLFDKITEGDEIRQRTFSEFVEQFSERELETFGFSPVTLTEYRRMLAHVSRYFTGKVTDDITTNHIARFLRGYPPRTSCAYRTLLLLVFKHAKSEGIRSAENPVTDTLRRRIVVQRERLSAAQYRAVWEQAAPHIRNAMDLALHTLQRREDIAQLRFADHREGHIWVRPQKGEKFGTAIRIAVHEELAGVIARCRDGVLSPWMVHQPINTNKIRRGKQLSKASLSRGFRLARNAADPALFPEDKAKRPSFHEIRGLGAKRLRDVGIDPQSLLGHRDPETTRLYLSRHEVTWVTVSARVPLD